MQQMSEKLSPLMICVIGRETPAALKSAGTAGAVYCRTMLFSSITFLYFFLPLTLAAYYLVPRRLKNHVLLLASVAFYAFGEPQYVGLLLLSAGIGWGHGLYLQKHPGTRWALYSAIAWNLAFLLFFKYADFLIVSCNGLFHTAIPALGLALPVGISFYTFQNMSYIIDVYRGDCQAEQNPAAYAAYLCLFPQLIAGPIVRYSDVARDLRARNVDLNGAAAGVVRFAVGLGKKVLLADAVGQLAELTVSQNSILFSWLQAASFMLQIYFDFSGYSDMAIGLGAMLGFSFPENFDAPYCARSVTEFWRRWHKTLGGWFRDYVYIPLGGNRTGRWRWLRNMLAVWMLTGLWHGASWNFLLWGLYYGLLLAAEKLWLGKYLKGRALPHLYVLLVTLLGFVLFHSASLPAAGETLGSMFGLGGLPLWNEMGLYYLRSYAVLLLLCVLGATPWPRRLALRLRDGRAGALLQPVFVLALLLLVTACLVDGSFHPFLYFRF